MKPNTKTSFLYTFVICPFKQKSKIQFAINGFVKQKEKKKA